MAGTNAGTMVTFVANGGTASGYLALPPGGSGPGLLVLQEWWGLVPHIKDVADRFAAAGYVALAPDLYRGKHTTHPDEAQRLLMALHIADTATMLRGAAEYLRGHAAVTPRKVGVLGFCMGGQLALFAATAHPDVIDAVVDFYGIFNPAVPVDLSRLQAPVLAHFGTRDPWIPREKADALMAEVAAAGVPHEVHHYDAGHAFFNDARPEAYDAAAAGAAWETTLGFLRRHLA
jgi:carboxymethylenebutenolidase